MMRQTSFPLKSLILLFLGLFLFEGGHRTSGETKFDCALSLVGQLNEPRDKADALVGIAKLFLQDGDRQSADRLLSEALDWAALIQDGLSKEAVIGAVSEVGCADHVERAREIAKSLGGSNRAGASRQLIGAYSRLGLTDKASELLTEAAQSTRSAQTRDETWYGDRELAMLQNKYRKEPPQQMIADGSGVSLLLSNQPVGEQELVRGYLAAGQSSAYFGEDEQCFRSIVSAFPG